MMKEYSLTLGSTASSRTVLSETSLTAWEQKIEEGKREEEDGDEGGEWRKSRRRWTQG